MTEIRKATIFDIERIVELGHEAHKASPVYRDHAVCEPKFRKGLAHMISSKRHYVGVIERGGVVEGALMGTVNEMPFSTKKKASDVFFYITPKCSGYAPALISDFRVWAWDQNGVVMVGLANSSGLHIEKTEQLYSMMGLQRVGGIWLDKYLQD